MTSALLATKLHLPPTQIIPPALTDLELNEVSLSLGESYIYIRVPKDISEEDAKKLTK